MIKMPLDKKQMAKLLCGIKKSSGNADAMDANQKIASYTTSETTIISPEDTVKIRKDAETADVRFRK